MVFRQGKCFSLYLNLQLMPFDGKVEAFEPIKVRQGSATPGEEERYGVFMLEDRSKGFLCWSRCVKVLTEVFGINDPDAVCHRLNKSGKELLREYDTQAEAQRVIAQAATYFRKQCRTCISENPFLCDRVD